MQRTLVVGGITTETIMKSLELCVGMSNKKEEVVMANDYTDSNISIKVVKVIKTYTDIVNSTIRMKK